MVNDVEDEPNKTCDAEVRVSCLYSRRGHTWRELGAVPMATGVIDHARRACAKCGAPGYVDKQGRVIFGISSISGDGKRRDLGRA